MEKIYVVFVDTFGNGIGGMYECPITKLQSVLGFDVELEKLILEQTFEEVFVGIGDTIAQAYRNAKLQAAYN